ncbi:MAG: DMT family transporter [Synergistaceae bacterium]|nr:DMT family transporter [Synergistaceae bacterium]
MSERSGKQAAAGEATYYDYAMILATVTIWGGSFASTKYALAQAEPMLILWIRLVIGMPVLFAGLLWEKSVRLPTKHEAISLFLMGFQGIFFHQAIQSYAMKTAGAANANWMMIATPALVAILGRIFLKEKISNKGIFGMILAAVGVTLVIGRGTIVTANSGSFGSMGDLIMLLSVLNWAIFLLISRRVLKKDLSPAFVIFWEMFFALMAATPFSIFIGSDFSAIASFSSGTWAALIFLGAFSSALAYIFWFRALSIFTVAKVAVFQFLQPIAGVVISYFLVGERFTPWLFAGGAMILCGVWLVNKK